jgi:hypothetical protein
MGLNSATSSSGHSDLIWMSNVGVEEIRITKRLAWTYTNYLITLHVAAVYYIRVLFDEDLSSRGIFLLAIASILLSIYAGYLLWGTATRNARNRTLLVSIGEKIGGTFAELNDPPNRGAYLSPCYDLHIVVPLMLICAATSLMFVTYRFHLFCP